MPETVEAYHQRWQKVIEPAPGPKDYPWGDERITRTSCVLFEAAVHSAVGGGEGFITLPDFGDAICLYRYLHLRDEFASEDKLLSPEDLARKETAQRELDALLERYVHEGYQQGMGEEFIAAVERSFRERELLTVYSLPEDLPRLLADRNYPHVPEDEKDEDADAEHLPAFDFDNPEHCRALENSLVL